MKSSHCPKYERKNLKNSALMYSGQNFSSFWFIFWAKRRLHIFILKFPDLYQEKSKVTNWLKNSRQIMGTQSYDWLLTGLESRLHFTFWFTPCIHLQFFLAILWWFNTCSQLENAHHNPTVFNIYRGSPPYADFGTWKKSRYAKFT